MCCFSGDEPVIVSGTKIFSRLNSRGENVLIYEMDVDASTEVAMVLPVPRRDGGRFKFVDFSDYDDVFKDLESLFAEMSDGDDLFDGGPVSAVGLPVQRVGNFDASFVPALADFSRIDARFRLAPGVWEKLPAYAAWSFAVFKLRPGAHTVHPMGLAFETRFAGKAYFPTVHVHDGDVHKDADFDHTLYAQGIAPGSDWKTAGGVTAVKVRTAATHGFVRALPVYRRRVVGRRRNADIWAPVSSS